MTRNPAESLITAMSAFLEAEYNDAITAFNTDRGDGVDISAVTWGDGYSDLLNAMGLPAGDVYLFTVEIGDSEEGSMATGEVDIAIRVPVGSNANMKKTLTRYADLVWQLVEDNPTLGGRVVLAQMISQQFGISSEKRDSAFVVVTVSLFEQLDV